jgi:cell division protein FtsL
MTKREKCLTILLAVVIFIGIVTTSITYKANNTLQNKNEDIAAQNAALIVENNDKNETNKLLCEKNVALIAAQDDLNTQIDTLNQQIEDEAAKKAAEEAIQAAQSSVTQSTYTIDYSGAVLNPSNGSIIGPSGKETYYNLDMSGVVRIMRNMGYSAEEYPYWVRSDGAKMLGSYVMVAANLNLRPRGSIVLCSLGEAIVADTGGFAEGNPTQLDIATAW